MKIPEFGRCLEKGKIVPFSSAPKLVNKEKKAACDDLLAAQESLRNKNYKWATVQAYYAMFHAARALLYRKGYREKSHYCLFLSLKEFYGSEGMLEMRLIESFRAAKSLREGADYENTFDAESADSAVRQAEEFVRAAKKLCRPNKAG